MRDALKQKGLAAADKERIEKALERVQNQEEDRKRKEREREALRNWKKQEREKRSEGKKAWYLKDGPSKFFSVSPYVVKSSFFLLLFSRRSRQEEATPRGPIQRAIRRQTQAPQGHRQETPKTGPKGQESDATSASRCLLETSSPGLYILFFFTCHYSRLFV
jgi:hypothetical protein